MQYLSPNLSQAIRCGKKMRLLTTVCYRNTVPPDPIIFQPFKSLCSQLLTLETNPGPNPNSTTFWLYEPR